MLQASGGTSRDIKCSNRLEELGSSCHSIYYTKMTNTTYIALKFIKEALKSSLNEDLTQKEEHMTKFFFSLRLRIRMESASILLYLQLTFLSILFLEQSLYCNFN